MLATAPTRKRRPIAALAALAALLALPLPAAAASWSGEVHPTPSRASYRAARDLVEAAVAVFGIDPATPVLDLAVRSEGTLDRAARYQGYDPDVPQPRPYRQSVAVTADGQVGWEFRFSRHDGTEEGTRFAETADGRVRIVGLVGSFAVEVVDPVLATSAERVRRSLPPLLLRDALAEAAALRHLGAAEIGGRRVEQVQAIVAGEAVTLHFAADDGRLVGWESLADVPLWGDTTVRWELGDYRPPGAGAVGLALYPTGHRVYLEGRLLLDVRHTEVLAGAAASAPPFAVPDGVEVRRPPAPEPGPPTPPAIDELAPGVHVVRGLRAGFNHLAVELDDPSGAPGLLVVDAPAGWLELATEAPPSNFVPGATSSSVSQRLLDLLAERFPERPVRWLVLTHFHGDHAGGVRAFVAAGATVLAAEPTRRVVERALARPHTLAADALAAAPRPLVFEAVSGRRRIGAGATAVELLEVDPNPHAAGTLVVHLPASDLLYVSDLLYSHPLEAFPGAGEERLTRSFVGWLDDRGLAPGRILGAHGSALAGPEHLAKVRRTAPGGSY